MTGETAASSGPPDRARRGKDAAAVLLLALGLALRLVAARGSHLSGDEALHIQLARAPDAAAVYRTTLPNAHPPLFFLLLHFFEPPGVSEWALRLLPVLFGTAFLWAAYRWAGTVFGNAAALPALALLAVLPSLVSLSAELRAYGLLLLLTAAALLALERALRAESSGALAVSTGLLGLAMLTHYAGIRAAAAAFVYGAVRLGTDRLPGYLVRAWASCQAALGALFLFLYASHLSRLRGEALERQAQSEWLRTSYLQAGDSAVQFVWRQTVSLFEFLFWGRAAGLAALALTLAGVLSLAWRRRASALLVALPFLLGAASGLLGLYPFGGTRHSIDLALFAAAAIGVMLAPLLRRFVWPALLLAGVLLPAGFSAAGQAARDRPLEPMRRAIRELRVVAPAGSVFFTDLETATLLGFLLGGREPDDTVERPDRFRERTVAGYRLVSSPIWRFDGATFAAELRRALAGGVIPARQSVWLFQTGWGYNAAAEVSRAFRGSSDPYSRRFDRISLTQVRLP